MPETSYNATALVQEVLTSWITHSSSQVAALSVANDALLNDEWKPSGWLSIAPFDVVIGMHLVDLTQLFVYDASIAAVYEMATADRSLPWQRMQLTATAIVDTLRGMHYEGGGGDIERLSTAAIVHSQYDNLGTVVYKRYLSQRRREQATLDHRKAFPHTNLYTNALSRHTTLAGVQGGAENILPASTPTKPTAEEMHRDPAVRHKIPESEGVTWSRMSSTEILSLLRPKVGKLDKMDRNSTEASELIKKINEHPLFSVGISDGERHALRSQIAQHALELDQTSSTTTRKHPESARATLVFVPLQSGIPSELAIVTHQEVLSHVDVKKIPVLAVKCNHLGIVEKLWICANPGVALAPLMENHAGDVELCNCTL